MQNSMKTHFLSNCNTICGVCGGHNEDLLQKSGIFNIIEVIASTH